MKIPLFEYADLTCYNFIWPRSQIKVLGKENNCSHSITQGTVMKQHHFEAGITLSDDGVSDAKRTCSDCCTAHSATIPEVNEVRNAFRNETLPLSNGRRAGVCPCGKGKQKDSLVTS